jgi:hypothetical protein
VPGMSVDTNMATWFRSAPSDSAECMEEPVSVGRSACSCRVQHPYASRTASCSLGNRGKVGHEDRWRRWGRRAAGTAADQWRTSARVHARKRACKHTQKYERTLPRSNRLFMMCVHARAWGWGGGGLGCTTRSGMGRRWTCGRWASASSRWVPSPPPSEPGCQQTLHTYAHKHSRTRALKRVRAQTRTHAQTQD